MRLLVTRPEVQAEQTAQALRAGGHEVVIASLLRIETVPNPDLGAGSWTAVVLTSANAVRAIAAHRRVGELLSLPAFAVGERTAAAARDVGFTQVESANGDVMELAAVLTDRLPESSRILYLCGHDSAGDLAGMLTEAGFRVRTVVVYRAVADGWLPAEVAAALAGGSVDGVLHYSRRSALAFLAAAKEVGVLDKSKELKHFCLSSEVAVPLRQASARRIFVAARPNEQALLDLVAAN